MPPGRTPVADSPAKLASGDPTHEPSIKAAYHNIKERSPEQSWAFIVFGFCRNRPAYSPNSLLFLLCSFRRHGRQIYLFVFSSQHLDCFHRKNCEPDSKDKIVGTFTPISRYLFRQRQKYDAQTGKV
jgi:hypothetical protein